MARRFNVRIESSVRAESPAEAARVPVDLDVLEWAAVVHDVGRIDDGLDPEHGTRSALWWDACGAELAPELNKHQLWAVSYAVRWHTPADDQAPVMTAELVILKDADGLDRWRIGDLDPRYLRTEAARQRVDVARRLVVETERTYLGGASWEKVREIALMRGEWR